MNSGSGHGRRGGQKGAKQGKLETFEGARGEFSRVESMGIAKCGVFQGQETLLARGSFPGSVFQGPETLFPGGSKLKKRKVRGSQREVVLEAKND